MLILVCNGSKFSRVKIILSVIEIKFRKLEKNAIFEKNIGCAIQSQKQAKISTKTAKF